MPDETPETETPEAEPTSAHPSGFEPDTILTDPITGEQTRIVDDVDAEGNVVGWHKEVVA